MSLVLARSGGPLRCRCLDAVGREADIALVLRACRCDATDPGCV